MAVAPVARFSPPWRSDVEADDSHIILRVCAVCDGDNVPALVIRLLPQRLWRNGRTVRASRLAARRAPGHLRARGRAPKRWRVRRQVNHCVGACHGAHSGYAAVSWMCHAAKADHRAHCAVRVRLGRKCACDENAENAESGWPPFFPTINPVRLVSIYPIPLLLWDGTLFPFPGLHDHAENTRMPVC